MAYKLLDMAHARWHRLDGAHLLPLVRAGVTVREAQRQAEQLAAPLLVADATGFNSTLTVAR